MFRIKRKFALIPREVWSKRKGNTDGQYFHIWLRWYYVIQRAEPSGWETMEGYYKYLYETECYSQFVNIIKHYHTPSQFNH